MILLLSGSLFWLAFCLIARCCCFRYFLDTLVGAPSLKIHNILVLFQFFLHGCEFVRVCTYTLLSVREMVSSVWASEDKDCSSLSCAEPGIKVPYIAW